MSDPFDWRVIDRHLAGESSPADDATLALWLAADARNPELLERLRAEMIAGHGRTGDAYDVDAAWSRLSGRLATERPARHLAIERAAGSVRHRAPWRVVAVVATLAAAAVLAVVWRAPRAAGPARSSLAMREVASARAQQTHVTLRDGTRVVLNSGSRLRYAADFGGASRDVELDGEGYFDVVHDAARPFRVRTRGGVAEDLGTRFAVRAYDGALTQVVVAQGSVSLGRDGGAGTTREVLRPGQLGRVERDGRVTVASGVDVDRWVSWTRGALALDGLSLAEAAAEIGRRYDVRIVVPDPGLARRRVSARFNDAPLPAVLDALSVALDAQWANDGVAIVIRKAP